MAFKIEGAKTVSVNVSWTPGYSGGYDQVFTINYRVKGSDANFVEQSVDHPDNNMYTVQGLLPNKTYEFTVQASNQAGKSQASAPKKVMTPGTRMNILNFYFCLLKCSLFVCFFFLSESSLPPDRGIGMFWSWGLFDIFIITNA